MAYSKLDSKPQPGPPPFPVAMDRQLDWGARSQHGDLQENLDALVDPETQRIMDEADLLEYVSPVLVPSHPSVPREPACE